MNKVGVAVARRAGSRITDVEAIEIRKLDAEGGLSRKQIAKMFKVPESSISHALDRSRPPQE